MYRVVIDANVWIRFARSKDIAPLLDRFITYRFLPVINNYLLAEIFTAVVQNNWLSETSASRLIELIRRITLVTAEKSVYRLSLDPKDNYLFDLAIQHNCVFIITDDHLLLSQKLKPVPYILLSGLPVRFQYPIRIVVNESIPK